MQFAGRKNRKGKAMAGMMMGIRWKLVEKREEIEERTQTEEIVVGKIKAEIERIRIMEVYVNGDLERILQNTRKWVEEREEKMMTLIGGDFNARTGGGGGWRGVEWGR